MKPRVLVLALACGMVAAMAGPAQACSCAPLSKEELAKSARTVFTGTAVSVEKGISENSVRFRVGKVYKGKVDRRVDVVTASNSAACGCFFKEGQRYTVFGSKNEPFRTNLCSGTSKGGIDPEEWGLPPGHSPG